MDEMTQEETYAKSKLDVLACVAKTLGDARASLFIRDAARLRQAREAARALVRPGACKGNAEKEVPALRRLSEAAEELMQRIQDGLEAGIRMEPAAEAHVSELITLAADAARDAGDMTAPGTRPDFRRYVLSNTAVIADKVRGWTAGNGQNRNTAALRPDALTFYQDIMGLLEKIADRTAAIVTNA